MLLVASGWLPQKNMACLYYSNEKRIGVPQVANLCFDSWNNARDIP